VLDIYVAFNRFNYVFETFLCLKILFFTMKKQRLACFKKINDIIPDNIELNVL